KRTVRTARVPRSQLMEDVRTGFRWLCGDPFARIAMPLAACMTLVSQALIMVFLCEAHARHLSSLAIGAVLAASGVGGAFGAVAGSRLRIPRVKIQPYI